MCKDIQQYLSILWPMVGNTLKSVSTWLWCMKFNEIYVHYSDAEWNSLFRKWVYIAETARVQRKTKK